MCACVRACMRACVRACVHVCMHACVCVCIFCIIMLEHLSIYIYILIFLDNIFHLDAHYVVWEWGWGVEGSRLEAWMKSHKSEFAIT